MKLIPPDLKQCQCEHQVGAFTLGGVIGQRTRCTNKPIVIVTERKAGPEGKKGSMSLCVSCLTKAYQQLGTKHFTVEKIEVKKKRLSAYPLTSKKLAQIKKLLYNVKNNDKAIKALSELIDEVNRWRLNHGRLKKW